MKTTAKKTDEKAPLGHLPVRDRFSDEQEAVLHRLMRAGKFKNVDETIVTLTEAALYVFGLDPVSRAAFDRVSKAAETNEVDDDVINNIINEMFQAGERWTLKQRNAEREARLAGRVA